MTIANTCVLVAAVLPVLTMALLLTDMDFMNALVTTTTTHAAGQLARTAGRRVPLPRRTTALKPCRCLCLPCWPLNMLAWSKVASTCWP